LIIAACSPTTPPTATVPAPSPTAPILPTTPVDGTDRYAALPQESTVQGFPQIGYPSAAVDVVLYSAFDDLASGTFYRDSFPTLLARVRSGEIRLIFVPLSGRGTLSGGRGAARAALCAGEQGAFWRFHDLLFDWQAQFPAEPFAGDRLLTGAAAVGIDQSLWNECLLADRADLRLDDAARFASNEPNFTSTPYVTINGAPSLTDAESLDFTINLMAQRFNESVLATTAPEDAAATPEITIDPNMAATLAPLITQEGAPPPFDITLPEGWGRAYSTIVLQDIDAIRNIPFALYQGPVTGGMGTIIVLWAFPNLIPSGGLTGADVPPDLYIDGTRLLRLAVVEERCNIGTDLRREYSVGGLAAVGTSFAAVDCPGQPNTRGWFAGLQQFNLNFVFYVYAEPLAAMDVAEPEMQALLDSVRFVLPQTAP